MGRRPDRGQAETRDERDLKFNALYERVTVKAAEVQYTPRMLSYAPMA